jgi:hypothetical protein
MTNNNLKTVEKLLAIDFDKCSHEGFKKTISEALPAALWWYARAGV